MTVSNGTRRHGLFIHGAEQPLGPLGQEGRSPVKVVFEPGDIAAAFNADPEFRHVAPAGQVVPGPVLAEIAGQPPR
jgi:hypothetical protein